MQKESRILDAPNLKNDYYLNIVDWGNSNLLAVALGSDVYTLNISNFAVCKLLHIVSENDYPTSLSWSQDSKTLAIGHMCSEIHLWDAEASKPVWPLKRCFIHTE